MFLYSYLAGVIGANLEKAIITFYPAGELTQQRFRTGVHFSHGQRGSISKFSSSSRSRLMRRLSMVQKGKIPLFVTLTYHEDYGLPFQTYKEHLHKFGKYLKRKFPKMGFIWKLEFQKRGTQHFHLFLWGVPIEAKNMVSAAWTAIVAPGSEQHKKFHMGEFGNEHCVKIVTDLKGMKSYCVKYMLKDGGSTAPSGRYWGVVGNVPFSQKISFTTSYNTAIAMRQLIQRETGMQSQTLGYWAGAFSVDWLIYLNWLIDQEEIPPEPKPIWNWIYADLE